jgi:hypothetical protein
MLACHCTSGMTEDKRAGLELRGRRTPPPLEAIVEEFIFVRLMRPHGDRRDRSQSRRVEAQEYGSERQDHIMGVLVLRDDFGEVDVRRLALAPAHQVRQGQTLGEGLSNRGQNTGGDWLGGADRNGPHTRPTERSLAECHVDV